MICYPSVRTTAHDCLQALFSRVVLYNMGMTNLLETSVCVYVVAFVSLIK